MLLVKKIWRRTNAATCRIEPIPANSFDNYLRRVRLRDSGALPSEAAIVSSSMVGDRDHDLRRRNIDRVDSHLARLAIGVVQGLVHCRGAAGRSAARHRHGLSVVR